MLTLHSSGAGSCGQSSSLNNYASTPQLEQQPPPKKLRIAQPQPIIVTPSSRRVHRQQLRHSPTAGAPRHNSISFGQGGFRITPQATQKRAEYQHQQASATRLAKSITDRQGSCRRTRQSNARLEKRYKCKGLASSGSYDNQKSRLTQTVKVLEHMEMTTGVTNRTLAQEIKNDLQADSNKTQPLAPSHTVFPPRYTGKQTESLRALEKRRLSDFYNKQELFETAKARKAAKEAEKKRQAQLKYDQMHGIETEVDGHGGKGKKRHMTLEEAYGKDGPIQQMQRIYKESNKVDFDKLPRDFKNFLLSINSAAARHRARKDCDDSQATLPFDVDESQLLYWLSKSDPDVEKMIKVEFDRAGGHDQEYQQMLKAFTYGLKLNRQGLTPIKTVHERMADIFEEKALRKRLYLLTKKKSSSVCGDRDPKHVKTTRDRRQGNRSLTNLMLSGPRQSLSLYSERPHNGLQYNQNQVDKANPEMGFEWRYRVRNRDHIPDFFPGEGILTRQQVSLPLMRFSTPERMTYHLPTEEQPSHEGIEIDFIQHLAKDKLSAGGSRQISSEEAKALLSQHQLRKKSVESIDEDLLFGTDSEDSFTQDYNIPKQTLRRERIVQRDKVRFAEEKTKRAKQREERLAHERAEAEAKKQRDQVELEAQKRLDEEQQKLEEAALLKKMRSKTMAQDKMRLKSYRDEKIALPFREKLEAQDVKQLYSRKFVVRSMHEADDCQNSDNALEGHRKNSLAAVSMVNPVADGMDSGEEVEQLGPPAEMTKGQNYKYRDWREIMQCQQESLKSLISLGVITPAPATVRKQPKEVDSPEGTAKCRAEDHLLIQGSKETVQEGVVLESMGSHSPEATAIKATSERQNDLAAEEVVLQMSAQDPYGDSPQQNKSHPQQPSRVTVAHRWYKTQANPTPKNVGNLPTAQETARLLNQYDSKENVENNQPNGPFGGVAKYTATKMTLSTVDVSETRQQRRRRQKSPGYFSGNTALWSNAAPSSSAKKRHSQQSIHRLAVSVGNQRHGGRGGARYVTATLRPSQLVASDFQSNTVRSFEGSQPELQQLIRAAQLKEATASSNFSHRDSATVAASHDGFYGNNNVILAGSASYVSTVPGQVTSEISRPYKPVRHARLKSALPQTVANPAFPTRYTARPTSSTTQKQSGGRRRPQSGCLVGQARNHQVGGKYGSSSTIYPMTKVGVKASLLPSSLVENPRHMIRNQKRNISAARLNTAYAR